MTPIKDLADEDTFFKGTRFRVYNVGLSVDDKSVDYYEYMLAVIPGDNEHMLMTCVEGYKAGSALALIKVTQENNNCVNGKALKFSIGIKDTYLIEE